MSICHIMYVTKLCCTCMKGFFYPNSLKIGKFHVVLSDTAPQCFSCHPFTISFFINFNPVHPQAVRPSQLWYPKLP